MEGSMCDAWTKLAKPGIGIGALSLIGNVGRVSVGRFVTTVVSIVLRQSEESLNNDDVLIRDELITINLLCEIWQAKHCLLNY